MAEGLQLGLALGSQSSDGNVPNSTENGFEGVPEPCLIKLTYLSR